MYAPASCCAWPRKSGVTILLRRRVRTNALANAHVRVTRLCTAGKSPFLYAFSHRRSPRLIKKINPTKELPYDSQSGYDTSSPPPPPLWTTAPELLRRRLPPRDRYSRWLAVKIAGPRTLPILSSRPGVTVILSSTAATSGRSTGRRWLTPSTPFTATLRRLAGRTFSARTVSIRWRRSTRSKSLGFRTRTGRWRVNGHSTSGSMR